MNKIILSGRLTADPEARKTASGIDVCSFTLAVGRPGTKKEDKITDFFRCTVWGGKEGPGRAGVIEKYFHKGDGITVEGVMTTRKYQDKNGSNVTAYDVQVDGFEFPMVRKSEQGQPEAQKTVPVSDEPLPF